MEIKPIVRIASIPLTSIFVYFGLSGEVLIIYACLIVVDTILGMLSAYHKGIGPTSKDWNKGVSKKFSRLVLPFVLGAVSRGSGYGEDYIAGVMTALLGLLVAGEGYSIIRHIYNINTGKTLPEIDVIEILATRFTAIFKIKKTGPDDTAQG